MAEANDIRSLLTSKSRARVAPRDASLTRKTQLANEEVESQLPNDDPIVEERPQVEPPQVEPTIQPASVETDPLPLQADLTNLPTMGKRLAVNLEQSVRADLMTLCDRQDITPEIFFEAATVFLNDRPELLDEVIADAKNRLYQRKRAGLVRRTMAMMQKYGG